MNKEWFQARLRWAEMADGEGLRGWQDGIVLLRASDEGEAFQKALRIGQRPQGGVEEDGGFVGLRLAEVVTLDRIGALIPDEFEVAWERRPAAKPLPDDYEFAPERRIPAASF
jgi:hypothetical protein